MSLQIFRKLPGAKRGTKIYILTIYLCGQSNVFRPFHTPLQLQGIHANAHQLTDMLQTAMLPGTQVISRRFLSLQIISLTARLCTTSTVTAASPQHTAEKTLSGITVTQSSMNKYFDL